MIKSDELSNMNSCLNKAYQDEPIFVLRAKDPIAPMIIHLWCEARDLFDVETSDAKLDEAKRSS